MKFDGEICGGVLVENASDDFPSKRSSKISFRNFAGSSPPSSPKTSPTSLCYLHETPSNCARSSCIFKKSGFARIPKKPPKIRGGLKSQPSGPLKLTPFCRDFFRNSPIWGSKVQVFAGQLSGRVPPPSSVRYVLTAHPIPIQRPWPGHKS